MYRQYENPRELEEQLRLLKVDYDRLLEIMSDDHESETYKIQQEQLFSLHERISELEQRVNFAWQDEEFG